MSDQSFPVRKTLRIDPLQYAHQIESILGEFLIGALADNAFVATTQSVNRVAPLIPKTGISMVDAVIESLLDWHAAYSPANRLNSKPCWLKFIKPEYHHIEALEYISLKMDEMLLDLHYDIKEFLGEDRWIVHFKRQTRSSIYVEKSIDYRIYQWMQEHPEESTNALKKIGKHK